MPSTMNLCMDAISASVGRRLFELTVLMLMKRMSILLGWRTSSFGLGYDFADFLRRVTENRANLDGTIGHRGALGPGDGLFHRFHLPNRVTGYQLLGFSKRAVRNDAVRSGIANTNACGTWLQAFPGEHDSCLGQFLLEFFHLLPRLRGRHHPSFGLLGGLAEHHDSHVLSSLVRKIGFRLGLAQQTDLPSAHFMVEQARTKSTPGTEILKKRWVRGVVRPTIRVTYVKVPQPWHPDSTTYSLPLDPVRVRAYS